MESVTKSPDDKKGSKGFKRAQEHRKNLINQAVNLLSEIFGFEDDVAEVRLEKLRRWVKVRKNHANFKPLTMRILRHKFRT